jgi:phosphatidylglycerophosphate synthase
VLGALIFIFATILDGCDGEVARLSLRTSKLGGKLDLIGDNIVNAAVFLAIGYASFRAEPTSLFLTAVGTAVVGLCLATAAGFWYSAWLTRSGRQEAVRDTYESLVSRDFAYLILVLAALGKLSWFVWAAALGSNLFALLLVALRLREWPPEPAAVSSPSGEESRSRGIAPVLDSGRGP